MQPKLYHVVLVLVAIMIQDGCDACTCMPVHPQTQYCKSDFVILARIKRERTFKDHRIYKVRIRKELKLTDKALVALKAGQISTPLHEATCGVHLDVGNLYVLSGRVDSLKAHIYLCDMIRDWTTLTRRQRKGLRALYKHGCDCTIRKCRRRCLRRRDVCNWSSECQTREGICRRSRNGVCGWTRNADMNNCIRNETIPTISRWSG